MKRFIECTALIPLFFIIAVIIFPRCDNSTENPEQSCNTGDRITMGSGSVDTDADLVKQTMYGAVQGFTDVENTLAWLGIPYAETPAGTLRWKAPRPPRSWEGVREAREFCAMCPQVGSLLGFMLDADIFGVPMGSEDCLSLNIWRPAGSQDGLPVLVWIHGGGNTTGNAAISIYNGAHFAARTGTVVVSINYRLGLMGWFRHPCLETGDPLDDSGNYGTLDIIMALKWVRDNITAFGGDPGNVTIAGESAGGANVYSMLISPKAAGLFHRAISQSGFISTNTVASGESASDALIVSLLVKDGLAETREAAEALMAEKGNVWLAAYLRAKSPGDLYGMLAVGPGGLTTGGPGQIYEDGVVIPKGALARLKSGRYNRVPFIAGCNREEMKIFLPLLISRLTDRELAELIATMDPDDPGLEASDILYPALLPVYEPLSLAGSGLFSIMGVEVPAFAMSLYQDDVYAYRFDWDNETGPIDFVIGACHGLEISFLFGVFDTSPTSLFRFAWSSNTEAERESLSRTMMEYWSQFMRNGDPNSGDLPLWEPVSLLEGKYKKMILDGDISLTETAAEDAGELDEVHVYEDLYRTVFTMMGVSYQ
ncbi:MAG: hypothetical protein CVV44_05160 [Spirochaetae bacterium HGW-Spirochaetae-1]|jgi:para-nitrobenzyl esterase|nr:MAG: hypothetical protein CVV44_05160 [Spirochaetae bacterium HGW-Spirochaetae-1]